MVLFSHNNFTKIEVIIFFLGGVGSYLYLIVFIQKRGSCTKPRMDKIQDGQNPALDKIPNGQNPGYG